RGRAGRADGDDRLHHRHRDRPLERRRHRSAMRRALLSAALLFAACAEESTGIQPLPPPTGAEARRAPIAEPPSPTIVSPHLRRADSPDRPARDLRPSTGGGGGGGGGGWAPPPVPPPSA